MDLTIYGIKLLMRINEYLLSDINEVFILRINLLLANFLFGNTG